MTGSKWERRCLYIRNWKFRDIIIAQFLISNFYFPFFMSNTEDKIKKSLENIRPNLQADGGDAQLVEWDEENGIAKLQLMGACVGCPMSRVTLKDGVETLLTKEVPEVKKVEAV